MHETGGAVGRLNSPKAYAEIEGEESEMISIDAPVSPHRDLVAMLKQTAAVPSNIEHLSLRSYFIAVDEERKQSYGVNNMPMADHVFKLMQEYQGKDDSKYEFNQYYFLKMTPHLVFSISEVRTSPNSPGNGAPAGGGFAKGGEVEEKYEKGIPVHGDIIFHNFLSRIQENPGQILR